METQFTDGGASPGEISIRDTWRRAFREQRFDALALGMALCVAPVSIAATEILLAVALAARVAVLIRSRQPVRVARVFWYWLVWAGAEIVSWVHSGADRTGSGEIRHLLLIAAMFAMLPALDHAGERLAVWQCLFVTASVGSCVLVAQFVYRLIHYRREIAAADDPSFYLRSGGLLHHWMIYAVVEVFVFAALLRFNAEYPEKRKWLAPMFGINGLAIVLSLTRALWLACFVVLAVHLAWRRSKWLWSLPLAAAFVYLAAPAPVRTRIKESFDPAYYSNAERVEMWRVGWRMIRERPVFGVGPGRVEALFTRYATPGEPLPSYHGHLHDNALQLAAQFGLPVLAAALWFLAMLLRDLLQAQREAFDRETRFLSSAAILGMIGFLITGVTDYTYGHSLGLIMGVFVMVGPLRVKGVSI